MCLCVCGVLMLRVFCAEFIRQRFVYSLNFSDAIDGARVVTERCDIHGDCDGYGGQRGQYRCLMRLRVCV